MQLTGCHNDNEMHNAICVDTKISIEWPYCSFLYCAPVLHAESSNAHTNSCDNNVVPVAVHRNIELPVMVAKNNQLPVMVDKNNQRPVMVDKDNQLPFCSSLHFIQVCILFNRNAIPRWLHGRKYGGTLLNYHRAR